MSAGLRQLRKRLTGRLSELRSELERNRGAKQGKPGVDPDPPQRCADADAEAAALRERVEERVDEHLTQRMLHSEDRADKEALDRADEALEYAAAAIDVALEAIAAAELATLAAVEPPKEADEQN